MKSLRASLYFLAVLFLFSACTVSEDPPLPAAFNDPFARANGGWIPGLQNMRYLDGAYVISRHDDAFPNSNDTSTLVSHAAFTSNNLSVEAGVVSVNGSDLTWEPNGEPWSGTMIYGNSSGSQNITDPWDSTTIGYTDFDGEKWSKRIPIAQGFGHVTAPDSISLSSPWKLTYEHPRPGDSILVDITAYDSGSYDAYGYATHYPDTGSIVVLPSSLPEVAKAEGYTIELSRFRFDVYSSPRGKKIGVYSRTELDPEIRFPVKP